MKIQRVSPLTGQVNVRDIDCTPEQLERWKNKELIQNVMPHVSVEDREFIMTGYTPEDWKKMFPEGDD